jgi:hypothetical protein
MVRVHCQARTDEWVDNDLVEPRKDSERSAERVIPDNIGQVVERRLQNQRFGRCASVAELSHEPSGDPCAHGMAPDVDVFIGCVLLRIVPNRVCIGVQAIFTGMPGRVSVTSKVKKMI